VGRLSYAPDGELGKGGEENRRDTPFCK